MATQEDCSFSIKYGWRENKAKADENDTIVRWKIESGVINDINLHRSNSLPPQGKGKLEDRGGWRLELFQEAVVITLRSPIRAYLAAL